MATSDYNTGNRKDIDRDSWMYAIGERAELLGHWPFQLLYKFVGNCERYDKASRTVYLQARDADEPERTEYELGKFAGFSAGYGLIMALYLWVGATLLIPTNYGILSISAVILTGIAGLAGLAAVGAVGSSVDAKVTGRDQ
jgi:hypothetical protein